MVRMRQRRRRRRPARMPGPWTRKTDGRTVRCCSSSSPDDRGVTQGAWDSVFQHECGWWNPPCKVAWANNAPLQDSGGRFFFFFFGHGMQAWHGRSGRGEVMAGGWMGGLSALETDRHCLTGGRSSLTVSFGTAGKQATGARAPLSTGRAEGGDKSSLPFTHCLPCLAPEDACHDDTGPISRCL